MNTRFSDGPFKRPRVSFHKLDSFEFENEDTLQTPENFLDEHVPMQMRPRSLSHHLSSTKVPSRRWLKIQATFWRTMMTFGMRFHDWAPPKPPKPSYIKKIPTDTVPIELLFYLPSDYYPTLKGDPSHQFPVIVNFHGGGFCLGDAKDDRYWARVAMEKTQAVFVSVNYRRAPEHPFPIPVDDCAESLLYLSSHAHELHIDPLNVALSGFSAGANLVFAVPIRLAYHNKIRATDNIPQTQTPNLSRQTSHLQQPPPPLSTIHSSEEIPSSTDSSPTMSKTPMLPQTRDFARPPIQRSTSNLLRLSTGQPLLIRTLIAFYPLLDWTPSRSSKKRHSRKPPACLPKVFTDLFDYSYLPPPDTAGTHTSPYASPGLAPDHMLLGALPDDIQMWLCEWDMLLAEGEAFSSRLEKLRKNISSHVIPRVPHGWDKSPNPFRDQRAIDALYEKAAKGMQEVFESDDGLHTRASSIADGLVGRQPRRSSQFMPL